MPKYVAIPETAQIKTLLLGNMGNRLSLMERMQCVNGCLPHLLRVGVKVQVEGDGFIRDNFIPCEENKKFQCGGQIIGGNFMVDPDGVIISSGENKKSIQAAFGETTNIITISVEGTKVAHVDEVLNFVSSKIGHHLTYISKQLGLELLKAAKDESTDDPFQISFGNDLGATTYANAVRSNYDLVMGEHPEEDTIMEKIADLDAKYEANANMVKSYLAPRFQLQKPFLLLSGHPSNHIRLPYMPYLTAWPSAANLVTANGVALIPTQHSARLKPAAAAQAVIAIYEQDEEDVLEMRSGKTAQRLAPRLANALAEQSIVFPISDSHPTDARVLATLGILDHRAKISRYGSSALTVSNHRTVDVFELYIAVAMAKREIPFYFIETSDLNLSGGNFHCATNRRF